MITRLFGVVLTFAFAVHSFGEPVPGERSGAGGGGLVDTTTGRFKGSVDPLIQEEPVDGKVFALDEKLTAKLLEVRKIMGDLVADPNDNPELLHGGGFWSTQVFTDRVKYYRVKKLPECDYPTTAMVKLAAGEKLVPIGCSFGNRTLLLDAFVGQMVEDDNYWELALKLTHERLWFYGPRFKEHRHIAGMTNAVRYLKKYADFAKEQEKLRLRHIARYGTPMKEELKEVFSVEELKAVNGFPALQIWFGGLPSKTGINPLYTVHGGKLINATIAPDTIVDFTSELWGTKVTGKNVRVLNSKILGDRIAGDDVLIKNSSGLVSILPGSSNVEVKDSSFSSHLDIVGNKFIVDDFHYDRFRKGRLTGNIETIKNIFITSSRGIVSPNRETFREGIYTENVGSGEFYLPYYPESQYGIYEVQEDWRSFKVGPPLPDLSPYNQKVRECVRLWGQARSYYKVTSTIDQFVHRLVTVNAYSEDDAGTCRKIIKDVKYALYSDELNHCLHMWRARREKPRSADEFIRTLNGNLDDANGWARECRLILTGKNESDLPLKLPTPAWVPKLPALGGRAVVKECREVSASGGAFSGIRIKLPVAVDKTVIGAKYLDSKVELERIYANQFLLENLWRAGNNHGHTGEASETDFCGENLKTQNNGLICVDRFVFDAANGEWVAEAADRFYCDVAINYAVTDAHACVLGPNELQIVARNTRKVVRSSKIEHQQSDYEQESWSKIFPKLRRPLAYEMLNRCAKIIKESTEMKFPAWKDVYWEMVDEVEGKK